MSSRSFRLETRSRARDEIKRIMQTVEKVRKWEKKWIETGLSNHLKVYKWVPVREENKEEEEEEEEEGSNKENQPMDVQATGQLQMAPNSTDPTLPEIIPVKESAVMEAPLPASDQPPPDLFLASDENTADRPSPTPATQEAAGDREAGREGGDTAGGVAGGVATPLPEGAAGDVEGSMQQETDIEKRRERWREREGGRRKEGDSRSRSRSPH